MDKQIMNKQAFDYLITLVGHELSNHNLYRNISYWCKGNGYMHAFDFYKKQAMDELTHMEWVMEFLDDRDSIPYIPSVELQEKDYKNILDVVDASITREIETEKLYEDIWEIHKDFSIPATFVLALKVRQEQVEEIGLFTTIRAELEMATNGGKDLGGANWALIDNIFAKYK